jgi:predicted membrane protein
VSDENYRGARFAIFLLAAVCMHFSKNLTADLPAWASLLVELAVGLFVFYGVDFVIRRLWPLPKARS